MTEKIEAFWQDATADDVARMMKGETVEARFRDHLQEDWSKTVWLLAGYDSTEENCWIDNTGCPWRYCQVYREPSWHANKPDPGPGYRLLEKLPDEELKPGDECFSSTGKWDESHKATIGGRQSYGIWYRRRLEQLLSGHRWLANGDRLESGDLYYEKGALLEVGHKYWGNKVMLTEAFMRKIEPVEPEPRPILTDWECREGDTYRHPNGLLFTITAKGFEVTE
jgi:hypothetical protein